MTTKAKTTKKQVQGMLLEGSFGEHTETPLTLSDPVTTTQMILKLSEIKAYDKNPRKEKNPRYDEIKESILSNKRLNNNFNITRRPGDDLFMIESGGNTRLQILNELYNETGDKAFNHVQCLFVPWSSESNILTSHLIENEMRGDMMLIDKAYAVKNLKEEMEIEREKELSRNEFSKIMVEKGYKISTRNLSRLNYAIELDQMIPQILRRGIGGTKIDEIKKLYQTYCDYCTDKTDRFDLIFMGVMTEHNENEEFNLKEVRTDLDEQLTAEIEVQSNHIFLEIQSRLVNATPSQINDTFDSTPPSFSPEKLQQKDIVGQNTTESSQSSQDNEDYANKTPTVSRTTSDKKKGDDKKTASPPTFRPTISNQEKDDDISLANLRLKNYELICDIAKPFTLEDVIHQIENGLGFMIECPQKAFDFTGPNEMAVFTAKIKYMVWWYLFVMSEQNMDVRRFYIWRHLELFTLYHEQERGIDSLANRVKKPPESRITLGLIQNPDVFSDKGFMQCFRLMENVRKIKKNHTEKVIWGYKE